METIKKEKKAEYLPDEFVELMETLEKLEGENKSLKMENKELKKELEKAHTAYRAIRKVNRAIMNGYV